MTARLPDRIVSALSQPAGASLVAGEVVHRRNRPAGNAFAYPAFCLRVPLSRLADVARSGIGVNSRGLVSFQERDHGPRDGGSLQRWVRRLLADAQVRANGEIVLYCFPRMLGYVFNPVSFFVCHDASGAVRAVLAEVNNTFGESHRYLLAHPDGRALVSGETLTAAKAFHVSPFCPVTGRYEFRFHFGPGRWLARIDYFDDESGAKAALLETHISGREVPLAPGTPWRLLWRYRWYTAAVVFRIHWQAFRLWAKRVPFFTKPAPPATSLSRSP